MGRQGKIFKATLAMLGLGTACSGVHAAPYASNVVKTGTTVNFILNEPADALTYTINGGAPQALDGTTKGSKMFTLGAAGDTFAISAAKNAATGFTIATGAVLPAENSTTTGQPANGLTQATNASGLNIISDEASLFTRYNSPRGVDVNRNPNTPNFGTSYIANSAGGAVGGRTLTDGLYAIRADQTDAFAYGDAAKNPTNELDNFPSFVASASSPYRIFVKDDGDLYVADYSDANGQLFKVAPDLNSSRNIFDGFGGAAPPNPPTNPDGTGLPPTQNHGSLSSAHVEGTFGTSSFKVYAIDEDLNTAHFTSGGIQNDRNSLWRWDVGATTPSTVTPTKIASGLIGDFPAGGITVDMVRGADGKFYMSQARSTSTAPNPGLLVADETGAILFNSLTESRALVNDPLARDILTSTNGIAISPDQKYLAIMVNSSDVAVIPLLNGIPQLNSRLLVDSGAPTGENSGRDIAFDAAGNIHYVSSGQGRYRVLAPGGNTLATTSFNGTSYAFTIATVGAEPDADFDGDGDIDGADFLTFQRGLGTAGDQPDGDADGDGFIDADDLAIFRNQFATATPVAGAVPEPSAWALAAVAGLACVVVALPRRRAALAPVRVVR